jgi:pimeloyl-ACP methyl ester carboxylesterase
MRPDAELGIWGMVDLVADFLDALDLRDVTLVSSDWGGGLLLTHVGRDQRVGRHVICACEAFDNYPPGLPGRLAALAVRVPGGVSLALRQLRVSVLRRSPLLFGWMSKRGVPDEIVRRWTAPGLASRGVREDLRRYGTARFDDEEMVRATEALSGFDGPALIVWGTQDKVMPPDHARRLARLMPRARLEFIDDAYVLLSEDQPAALTSQMRSFLAQTAPAPRT